MPSFNLTNDYVEQKTHITIIKNQVYQQILGFGGAFTESAAYVINQLNTTQQQKIYDMYFSEEGHKYVMGRTHIGSCDFSLDFYNYDETKGDTDLTHFNLTDSDYKYTIPFMQRAQKMIKARGESMKLVITPWSPPEWMKSNRSMTCLIPLSFFCYLRKEFEPVMANYLSKYVTALKANGIDPWALTPQNEPESGKPTVETMIMTAKQERDWIKSSLGPTLRRDHPELKILAYDHNKNHLTKWADTILGDKNASQYVDGMAFHWYTGDEFPNVLDVHNKYPDKLLIATEATEVRESNPQAYMNPTWSKGEHYAHDIIGDMNNWANGWIDWNLALDIKSGPSHADPTGGLCEKLIPCGSNSMIIIDESTGDIHPQAFYWYMGHISRYIVPGSWRIERTLTDDSGAPLPIEVLTAKTPDDKIVLVVMNRNDVSVSYSFEEYASGEGQAVNIPAHGIQTYVW